jgi:hypothetical protein
VANDWTTNVSASSGLTARLPRGAGVYATSVIVAGVLVLTIGLPQAKFERPALFALLLALSTAAAALKVTLPLSSGRSTMSVSYAVDFASLLLLGPHETMLVATASAYSQSRLTTRERNPAYRTLFNMASLVLTVQGAGQVLWLLSDMGTGNPLTEMWWPILGAATAYFVLNTSLVAGAVALTTGERFYTTWHTNFLWSAPGYFMGGVMAGLAVAFADLAGYWYWFAALAFAPVYLT